MSLLSKLLGGPEDDEVEEEEEPEEEEEQEEEEEPETQTWVELEKELTGTKVRRRAELQFVSGRTETIEYHDYTQHGDQRVYREVVGAEGGLDRTFTSSYYSTLNFNHEEVKEVTMSNIETVEVTEMGEEEFTGEIVVDREVHETVHSGFIDYVESHDEGKVYEKEVDDGSSE